MENKRKYDVALSYASEDRKYVDKVAKRLIELDIQLFYDKYEEANLWGKNLYTHLQDVYTNQADFTIIFISEHYSKKLWTNHERMSVQERAFKENREYILSARFDDSKIPGIFDSVAYIDLSKKSPIEFADLIYEKVNLTSSSENKKITPTKEKYSVKSFKVYLFIFFILTSSIFGYFYYNSSKENSSIYYASPKANQVKFIYTSGGIMNMTDDSFKNLYLRFKVISKERKKFVPLHNKAKFTIYNSDDNVIKELLINATAQTDRGIPPNIISTVYIDEIIDKDDFLDYIKDKGNSAKVTFQYDLDFENGEVFYQSDKFKLSTLLDESFNN